MRLPAVLATVSMVLAGSAGVARAQAVPPIPLSRFPHVAIISPVFSWDAKADVVRTISATCPQGRAIAGGFSIQSGNGSLRVRESFPDGSSWVMRVLSRRTAKAPQPIQVRAFAVCLLPVARTDSVQITQFPRLVLASHRFALPPGDVTTAERQACAQNTLVVSGGFGLDPQFTGRARPHMELSYPDKWGWNVRVTNDNEAGQPEADARVYSLCLGNEEGMDIRAQQSVQFVEAKVTPKAGGDALRQQVKCRDASAHAIAGGVRVQRGQNAAIEVQESYPDTPGSWTTTVANLATGRADATVTLYAVCLGP
jgi:hypothetical protein